MDSRQTNQSLLRSLPDQDAAAFIHLSHTSKHLHTLFKEICFPAWLIVKNLLTHVARGEQDEAENLLKSSPGLLTCQATIHHQGRYNFVNRTPYQIALANEDDDMCLMLHTYFAKLPNGENERIRQVSEQFPDGQMIKYGWDSKKARELLDKAFEAIIHDELIDERDLTKMKNATSRAVEAFHSYVTPQKKNQFTKGLIFDMSFFFYVIQKYEYNFRRFKNWDQRLFYCVRMRGYLERFLPTGYLRSYGQGISFTVRMFGCENEKLRGDGCKLRNGAPILPLDTISSLGISSFININGEQANKQETVAGLTNTTFCSFLLAKLMAAKKNKFADILPPPEWQMLGCMIS